jgi:hypothetical protein
MYTSSLSKRRKAQHKTKNLKNVFKVQPGMFCLNKSHTFNFPGENGIRAYYYHCSKCREEETWRSHFPNSTGFLGTKKSEKRNVVWRWEFRVCRLAALIKILAVFLLPTNFVTFGKILNSSLPQFLQLYNNNYNRSYLPDELANKMN